jgi:RNA polymerase sigma factor (sigma-70 family)
MEPTGAEMDINDEAKPAFDSELLAQMAATDSDRDSAEAAWEEFYRRHFHYLEGACRGYSRQIGEGRVVELVQDTFVKAFQRASTFKPKPCQSAEQDRRHVRGWLGSIFKNALLDVYRHEPSEIVDEDIELVPDPSANEQESGPEASVIGPMEAAFMQLGDREQEVLRETMRWYDAAATQQRMPSRALQELASQLGTTSQNIRQIRSRAIAKLRRVVFEKP